MPLQSSNLLVLFAKHTQQCNLERQPHTAGQYFVLRLVTIKRLEGKPRAEIRPLLDVHIEETGFRVRFFLTGFAQIIDNW